MSTELEIGYLVSVTCRGRDEAQIRALLLQGLAGCGLVPRRLDSNDLAGMERVVVTAFVSAHQRVDADVEKIVGRHADMDAGTASAVKAADQEQRIEVVPACSIRPSAAKDDRQA
jgi:hypothetical protein